MWCDEVFWVQSPTGPLPPTQSSCLVSRPPTLSVLLASPPSAHLEAGFKKVYAPWAHLEAVRQIFTSWRCHRQRNSDIQWCAASPTLCRHSSEFGRLTWHPTADSRADWGALVGCWALWTGSLDLQKWSGWRRKQNRLNLESRLHLGLDCGLWAICPVSMETTCQLENQAPGRKSPRALHCLKEYPNYLCNWTESYILLCLLGYDHKPIEIVHC